MSQAISREHIEIREGVCGGKPVVKGTRIRVWDVHVWSHLQGKTPAEIVQAFPQLTVADVHAALAYYFDHREEIERQMREAEEFATRMEKEQGPTRFTRLRDQVPGEEAKPGADRGSPPAPFRDPVIEVYKKDVDRTLLRENLKLSVPERCRKFERNMRLVFELRRAGKQKRDQAKGTQ